MRKQSIMERAWLKRGLSASLSVVLAATLAGVAPAAAFASEQDEADRWAEAIEEQIADKSIQTYAYSENAIALASDADAETLDAGDWYSLLDPKKTNDGILNANGKMYTATDDSVVTPVKLQNPWGTCWGFSIIAACETSMLSDLKTTYSATHLDLSELQLVGSVYKNGGVPESVSSSQAGEGYHNESKDPNASFNMGGFMNYGATSFASGIGPVTEEDVPYQNKGLIGSDNNEPIIECLVTYTAKGSDTDENIVKQEYLTEAEIADKEANTATVKSVKKYDYAGNYAVLSGEGESATSTACYTDWSVDDSWYTTAYYNLENSNILPETRNLDNDGKYESTNLKAVKAIQSELKKGRAVSVAFCADTSMPGQSGNAQYLSTNWAHYTNTDQQLNHAVTIVGYDNDYAASNFAAGFEDATAHTPEGNGAWLVKNSWGSEAEDFPNNNAWGMQDTNSESSGYFWLSYYDKSVTLFESFDFDVNSYSDSSEYYVDQYDYLPEMASYTATPSDTPTSSANIFTVDSQDSDGQGYNSIAIRTLSCATYKPNTAVTYQVYLLDDEATTPTDPAHSSLVYESGVDVYDFGGYHRFTLPEDDWINVRDGQRYAVVTTQQCTDDGLYYQGVAYNQARPTDEQVEQYRALVWNQTVEQYRQVLYPIIYAHYASETNPATGKQYTAEEAEEEANKMLDKMLEEDGLLYNIVKAVVDSAVDVYANSYLKSVVNRGESWTGKTTDGVTDWADWVFVTDAAKSEAAKAGVNIVADNAPVKAFAELTDYASIAELDALKAAIEAAKNTLASLKISTDGSDVAADTQWVTQEQYDALKAAIATAEAMLSDAGDYSNKLTTIAAGTPESDSVITATANLTVNSQAGTKAAAAASTKTKGNGTYAKTGDAATSAAAALACVATIAGAAAIASRRRQRD